MLNTVVKHAGGRRVSLVSLRVGRCARSSPTRSSSTSGSWRADTVCEGARLEQEVVEARLRCDAMRARMADRDTGLPLPGVRRQRRRGRQRREFEVESIEVEEAACIAQR